MPWRRIGVLENSHESAYRTSFLASWSSKPPAPGRGSMSIVSFASSPSSAESFPGRWTWVVSSSSSSEAGIC